MLDINHLSQSSLRVIAISALIFIITLIIILISSPHLSKTICKWCYLGVIVINLFDGAMSIRSLIHDSHRQTIQVVKNRQKQLKQVKQLKAQLNQIQIQVKYDGIKAEQTLDNQQIKQYLNRQAKTNQKAQQLQTKIKTLNHQINAYHANGTPTK